MERAPSRAKATNILRPSSRAQGPGFADSGMQPQARVLPGGARVITPSHSNGQPVPPVGAQMRRPPSAAQFLNHQLDYTHQVSYAHQQQDAMGRQRMNSYYEGMAGDPANIVRSGSRAEQQPPQSPHGQQRAPSRSGRPSTVTGFWPGHMAQQNPVPMGMANMFGGGFGTMGMGMPGAMVMAGQQPMPPLSGSRPSSALQVVPPPQQQQPGGRPGTATGHRPPSSADPNAPMVVNVARGGARVIGPMRAKTPMGDTMFLNPIPQSPSSNIGSHLVNHAAEVQNARDAVKSALSNASRESGRSRSNSTVMQPSEESMEAAEARVSRKIQDLEISNKSLMAVNAQLEARVKQQTEKIRDLNKQLKNRVPFDAEAAIDIEINDEVDY
ncbi:hypothetical protein DL89DRAFT_62122 [Linderina pennispora]|uniref:Uncharacterized protein n=1 Tax=Linderina pennispora TaxID=61395 RepID=A0A1Y1W0C3_9FUNG|nr:uncharacterized protein DL89DRAFT_62122 [Linderina pennispora]ORX66961.1 hypothetical protein DL89DRAFT_62122 [Linderina pennispora]